jgi:NADP-dependent 3-hydroxy acid dehydrogenase YdfG
MTPRPSHPDRRTAVVTGASSGIGAATARALAGAGHPVALGARRLDRCDQVAREIRDAGGEAIAVPLDVTDPVSVTRFAKTVTDELGEVEVLVSNAGTFEPGLMLDVSTDTVARDLDVNVLGAHRLVTALVAGMVERRRGDVVFVSSDVVRAPRTRMAGYVPAKFGLEGMALAMQMELEGSGVRTSLVRPGPTVTELGSSWDEQETTAALEDWIHWGLARHGGFLDANDIAAAVMAVVSAPRGTHLTLVEVQPEAPVSEQKEKA